MRILVNPHAGSFPGEERLRALVPEDVELVLTRDKEHLRACVPREGRVVVGGGDGTLRDVVQVLGEDPGDVILGLVPLGTGNDLARTLGLPDDVGHALQLAMHGDARPLDALRLTSGGDVHYGLNASVGGTPSQASAGLGQDTKKVLGPLAFMAGGAKALLDLAPTRIRLSVDGDTHEHDVLTVGIGNGQSCAGGVVFAPAADPADGQLEVMLLHPGTALQFADLAAKLAAREPDKSGIVTRFRCQRAEIEADEPMPFNLDGELVAHTPLAIEVLPSHVRFAR